MNDVFSDHLGESCKRGDVFSQGTSNKNDEVVLHCSNISHTRFEVCWRCIFELCYLTSERLEYGFDLQ